MHEKLSELKEKLDNLHTSLVELNFQQDDLIDLGAYTFPFLHSTDIVNFPK